MTFEFWVLLIVFMAMKLGLAPFLGRYIRVAVNEGATPATAWGRPLEHAIYKLAGVRVNAEMNWKRYALALVNQGGIQNFSPYQNALLLEPLQVSRPILGAQGKPALDANDAAKYFTIIPAAFVTVYPQLGLLNVMGLATPSLAILSAVIFNALSIIALIPLSLRGVRYRPTGAAQLLRRNLLIYGLGGLIMPFACIKIIDMALVAMKRA